MATYNDKELVLYLLACSRRCLGNFMLSRMNAEQLLVKEFVERVNELIDRIADQRAEVRWANLIRDHGEEIVERLAGSRSLPNEPKRIEPRASLNSKASD